MGHRRITFTKTAITLLVLGLFFCFSLQFQQLPFSSAKTVSRKLVSPSSLLKTSGTTFTGVHKTNHSESLKGKDVGKDVGKAGRRSPKQVNEDIKSRYPKKEDNPSMKLNHTLKSHAMAHVDPLPSIPGPNSLELLQEILVKANKAQTIYNQDKFPPLGEDGLVLIVQVHKREGYLKQLLDSLKVAKGIEKVLLVISHDHYYDDMNGLIRSIDFCPVST